MATTTEAVLQHHVQALMSGNLDELLKDYTEESVFFYPQGTSKGLKNIRAAFTSMQKMFPADLLSRIKHIKQDTQGDDVYVLWSAPPEIPFGGDSFCVRNGKIMMQSVF